MSRVFIGTRVEKTDENPQGWKNVSQIPADEVCVVFLGGDGTQDERSSNGNVKGIQEEIGKVFGSEVSVYGVGYNFEKNEQNKARKSEYVRWGMINSEEQREKIAAMNKGQKPDFAYIEELYKRVIEPRITRNRGTERIDVEDAAANLRKITFMAHCHGAFVALKLEDVMADKMSALGYSAKEQALIQQQMLVIAQAPGAPLGVSKSTFVSFLSANDMEAPRPFNYLSVYVQNQMREDRKYADAVTDNDEERQKSTRPFDLKPCFLSGRMGNCLLVKQKYAYDAELGAGFVNFKEHNFVGFHDEELTAEGKLLQKFAYNTMINGVKNSLRQGNRLVPLPEIGNLVCCTEKERQAFVQMQKNGENLRQEVYAWGRSLFTPRNRERA